MAPAGLLWGAWGRRPAGEALGPLKPLQMVTPGKTVPWHFLSSCAVSFCPHGAIPKPEKRKLREVMRAAQDHTARG